MENECSLCGGELMLIGRLGDLEHYGCRNCGMEVSRIIEDERDDEEEPEDDNEEE